MHIIAIGWLFCVLMLAIGASSVLAGALVFVFWGIGPLVLIFWIAGSRKRRARRDADDASTTPESELNGAKKISPDD